MGLTSNLGACAEPSLIFAPPSTTGCYWFTQACAYSSLIALFAAYAAVWVCSTSGSVSGKPFTITKSRGPKVTAREHESGLSVYARPVCWKFDLNHAQKDPKQAS